MPAPAYDIKITAQVTIVRMEFESFQQSERFQKVLIAFLLEESKKPAISPTNSPE